MALEQILKKISEDATKEVQVILTNASKEADETLKEIEKEASLLKDKIISKARAEEEFVFQKEVVARRLNARKEILKAKRTQLNNCFQDALDTLVTLNDALYKKLIISMLTKLDVREDAEIMFSTKDKSRITEDNIHKVNPHLELSFSYDITGGFILKTKELNFDNSLENILAGLRQDFEPMAAEILFEEVQGLKIK